MNWHRIKTFLIMLVMASMPVTCFCGAITSTIAWYTYDSGAVLAYNGTAISLSNYLQVGLKSTDPSLEDFGLKIEDGVAWSEPGVGLNPDQIKYYLGTVGYATDMFTPLTSGPYNGSGKLKLTAAPAYGIIYNDKPGEKKSYALLPLAFRILDSSGNKVKNTKVWLQDAEILCKEYENLTNGVRLHFYVNDDDAFILHPAGVDTESGFTALAGLQDLNFDGYYDYDFLTGQEYMYGQYTGQVNYSHLTESTGLHDINQTGHTSESTFCSKHLGNTNPEIKNVVLTYDGLTFQYAKYETLASIKPTKNFDGSYVGGRPICVTGSDDAAIGYTDMTIWIEGWDHSVYDKASGYRFLMNLTFNI